MMKKESDTFIFSSSLNLKNTNASNTLDSHRPLCIQLVRIPLMALLLTIVQADTSVILQQSMPCTELTAAEPAVAHNPLHGFPTGGAGGTGHAEATADAFAAVGFATSNLSSARSSRLGCSVCSGIGDVCS